MWTGTGVAIIAGAGLLLTTAGFGLFVWAARTQFVSRQMPPGMVVVSMLSVGAFLAVAASLVLDTRQGWHVWLGNSGQGLSIMLFLAALQASRTQRLTLAFTEDTPQFLLRRGPYRRIRHPLYAAYVVFWWSGAVLTLSPWAAVAALALTGAYVAAARHEERKFAASPLAEDYARYRRQAGLMWPVLGTKA